MNSKLLDWSFQWERGFVAFSGFLNAPGALDGTRALDGFKSS